MTTFAEPAVHSELDAVVSSLRARFPERSQAEVEHVVTTVYTELAATAKLTGHLIPLTLNKSRRLLSALPKGD